MRLMRPRGDLAGKRYDHRRFNEAAGNTPRKTTATESASSADPNPIASMRPRGIPRGKPVRRILIGPDVARFNEAAGNTPRKTAGSRAAPERRRRRFNEAAGNTPRKTRRASACRRGEYPAGNAGRASMRPRGIPRGKLPGRASASTGAGRIAASMRPRGIPRGKRRHRTSSRALGCPPRFNEAAGNTPRKTGGRADLM